jgi:hypothetical protein
VNDYQDYTHPAHSREFVAEVTNPANWLPLPPEDQVQATVVLRGQDSTSAAGMQPGQDFYAGYGGSSAFSNMASIESRFPGKKYLVYDTHPTQVDCFDIEPGGGSWSQAVQYFRSWTPAGKNLDKPAFYASAGNMGGSSVLAAAGIARSAYYLIVAQWDGSPSIPSGYDGKQYASNNSYDSESAYSYMWSGSGPVTPPTPASNFPLVQGSTDTADVKTLQGSLNRWASVIGLSTPLAVDGAFGPLTAAAVTLAQAHFGERGVAAGTCDQALFNDLKGTPGNTPPPPPPAGICAPPTHLRVTSSSADSAVITFAYVQGSVPAAYFQVAVCAGTTLGKVIPGYPQWFAYTSAASVTMSLSGLDTASNGYIIAVRAANAEKKGGSKWATVLLPKGGSVTPPPPPASPYKNPLRGITSLVPERIDQGVDYAGSGPLYSLGSGTVLNTSNSGWPGGAFISVRLSDGPFAGKIFYYAENITPAVSAGQQVTADTVLGTLIDAYPNCELGWAAEPGTGESMARAAGQAGANNPSHANTAFGKNFSDLLVSLGAPPGTLSGPVVGTLPSNWPAI